MAPQIELLTRGGVPVMAHIGFTPQSEHTLGGYRVQGRGDAAAADPRRRQGGRGRRRVRGRDGDGAGRRRRPGHPRARHPDDRHRRRRRSATARCWSGRTRSGCAPAGWRGSSSSTPTCTACCSTRRGTYAGGREGRDLPGPRAHLLSRPHGVPGDRRYGDAHARPPRSPRPRPARPRRARDGRRRRPRPPRLPRRPAGRGEAADRRAQGTARAPGRAARSRGLQLPWDVQPIRGGDGS